MFSVSVVFKRGRHTYKGFKSFSEAKDFRDEMIGRANVLSAELV